MPKLRTCKAPTCTARKPQDEMIVVGLSKWVCDYQCGAELAMHLREREVERKRKRQRQKDKAKLEAMKTAKDLMPDAQSEFNRYIRARDAGLPCPSCGGTEAEIEGAQGWKPGGAWDAGHFRSRGAASHLRFNTLNCHRQCKSCNGGSGRWGHTNNKAETIQKAYRETLIRRIGLERVGRLENDNRPRTFDVEYLRRVKAIFSRRARHIKKLRGIE